MRKNVTIMDVARDCGLSKSTVAYALSSSANKVSLSKREIVHKSASKLGYRPNIMAKSLRSGKTNSIGLLYSLGGPHDSMGLIRNISIRLMNKGYSCHIADSLSDPKIIKQCLKDFCSRNVDGLIIDLSKSLNEDRKIQELLRQISNVVVVSSQLYDSPYDLLVLNRTQATREIVDHFVSTGRKNIFLSIVPDNIRERVFIEQVKSHDLNCSEDSIIPIPDYYNMRLEEQEIGSRLVKVFQDKFNGNIPFDALICGTDEAAAALINYFTELGYKVPKDIAVTGFNNSGIAPYFKPALASVDRKNLDVAVNVTEMLLNRLEKKDTPCQRRSLEMKFIWRESAG